MPINEMKSLVEMLRITPSGPDRQKMIAHLLEVIVSWIVEHEKKCKSVGA